MKKLNKYIIISLLIISGCNLNHSSNVNSTTTLNNTSSTNIVNNSSNIITDSNIYNDIHYDGYYKTTEQSIYYKDVRPTYIYKHDLASIGNQKILVVPVKFKDSNYADTQLGGSNKVKDDIQKVMFGEKEETGWESVASYYEKSSYGKLKLSGEVTDWFTLDKTFQEVSEVDPYVYPNPSIYILREVSNWYKENYGNASEYDLDNDGYIDAIWMIYDYPAEHNTIFDWAFVYWDYMMDGYGIINDPIPYTYAWASIGFMYTANYRNENNETLVDAHTFIHETGHLLGLEDYYDYDGVKSYAGGLDMMDLNIGDHTGLSKYLLNWTTPYVVDGNTEITINSFTESGDLILVKNNWNHSALDEYLLIEFYTPTGLNEQDAKTSYTVNYPRLYSIPGIKIYHVDARLAKFNDYKFSNYTDSIFGLEYPINYSTQLAHSNTPSRSVNKKFSLYHLLEKDGSLSLNKPNITSKDSSLFIEGDYFDPIDFHSAFYNEERFNDGEYISYYITIEEITDTSATLKFRKI